MALKTRNPNWTFNTTSVSLSNPQLELIDDLMDRGLFASKSEVIRFGLFVINRLFDNPESRKEYTMYYNDMIQQATFPKNAYIDGKLCVLATNIHNNRIPYYKTVKVDEDEQSATDM